MCTRCHLQPSDNLRTNGGVQIICTCTARAACTPSPSSAHHLVTLVKLCQCAKFCVASSTFPKIRGSPVKKMSPPLARAARIHLGTGTPQCRAQDITHLPGKFQVYWSIQMASSTDQTRQCTEGVQIGCACIARASCTPAQFLGQHLVALVEIHQCAKFGVASSTFP